MNLNTYNAPWGTMLRFMSWFSIALGLIIPGVVYLASQRNPANWLPVGCLFWAILLTAVLFTIRSYAIEPDVLAIRRLLWTTRLPLSGLQSAAIEPEAMRGSLRLWGNGGMFSITGWYRNRALGNYRAFVTDLKRTVVLRFSTRTIVVSPEDPEQFVSEISQFVFRTA